MAESPGIQPVPLEGMDADGPFAVLSGRFRVGSRHLSYMSRLYATQPAIYGKARAWLAKCYIEQNWNYDAEDVIRNILRDSIHWRAQKEWDYTFADYYIHTGNAEQAIPYLRKVISTRCAASRKHANGI